MNENINPEPQPDNSPAKNPSELRKKILAGTVALGITFAGTNQIAGGDRNKEVAAIDASADDTLPESTSTTSTLPKSPPANATELVETTTTTEPAPTTTTEAPPTTEVVETSPGDGELAPAFTIENRDAYEFGEQQKNLRNLLNPQVGEEFTCVLTTRSLEAGSVVKDLDNNDVTLDKTVDVITPTLATSAAKKGEKSVHGYFFNYGEQQLYLPLTDEEVTTVEAGACTVNELNEQGLISSYTPEGGTQVNQPALVAVPRA